MGPARFRLYGFAVWLVSALAPLAACSSGSAGGSPSDAGSSSRANDAAVADGFIWPDAPLVPTTSKDSATLDGAGATDAPAAADVADGLRRGGDGQARPHDATVVSPPDASADEDVTKDAGTPRTFPDAAPDAFGTDAPIGTDGVDTAGDADQPGVDGGVAEDAAPTDAGSSADGIPSPDTGPGTDAAAVDASVDGGGTVPTDATPPADGGDTGGPLPPEDCFNGVDDDGDGLTDCADGDCSGSPSCIESNCANSIDDDGDSLTDCDDPDCNAACQSLSCGTYLECLVESGCSCSLDVDCPTGDAANVCAQNCLQNTACQSACFDLLTPQLQQAFNTWIQCMQDNGCFDQNLDQAAYSQCILDHCVDSYAECFQTGDQPCAYFYSCAAQCPSGAAGEQCTSDCADQLSPDGFAEAITWDDCRFGLCDADNDQQADGLGCLVLAGFYACYGDAPDCIVTQGSGAAFQGTAGCAQTIDCLTALPSFVDAQGSTVQVAGAVGSCIANTSLDAVAAVGHVVQCAIGACGTADGTFTPTCLQTALTGSCAAEWAVCQASDASAP